MAGLLDRLNALDAEQRRYTLETLVARLRDVEQLDRMRILFSDDAWMHGRYEGNGGTYDGYRADLAIAWEAMAGEAGKQIDAGVDLSALADCWRIGLIRSSLNSIAGNYPPALVAQAITTGFWTAEKALSAVPGIADLGQKLEICAAVLESDRTSPIMRSNAQKVALDLTLEAEDEKDRSKWLVMLAPLLDIMSLPKAKQTAQALESAEARVPALLAVGLRFGGREKASLLNAALKAAEVIARPSDRAEAIMQLVRHLRGSARDRAMRAALEATTKIESQRDHLVALAALLDHSGKAEGAVTQVVLDELWALDARDLAYSLGSVLPHLPAPLRGEVASIALERVKDLEDMDQEYDIPRPVALMALAPHLDVAGLEHAMKIAKSMSTGEHLSSTRAATLASLAERFAGDEKQHVVSLALEAARAAGVVPYLVDSLVRLIPLLPKDAEEAVLKEALSAAMTLWDEKPNKGLLGEVSPRLKALSSLAPHLSGDLLSEALGNARLIKDNTERALTLLSLARLLEGEERRKAMRLSYDAVWAIKDDQMGIFTIEEVFAGLEGDVAGAAFAGLDALPKKGYPNHWISAFVALAPRLSAQYLAQATETVKQVEKADDRAEAYTALAAYAEPANRDRYQGLVVESIRGIEEYAEHLIARAIRDAAPYLHGEHAKAAWNILVTLKAAERSEAIMAMASRLEGETALSALPVIRKLEKPYHRIAGLLRLSAALPDASKPEALSVAFSTAISMREDELDSEKAILELLPHLEGDSRDQAIRAGLARAVHFGHEEMGARTFAQLAPFITGKPKAAALDEALKRAVRIEEAHIRAEMLGIIFAQMDADGRQRALATALSLKEAADRFEVLASLARYLPAADVRTVRRHIVERLFLLGEGNRAPMLMFLGHPAVFSTPTVPDELRVRLVQDIAEVCWHWSWR